MPNKDIQEQKPFSNKSIEAPKPNAPRTLSRLSGHIAGSFNAGHNKVIAYKKVMAGEKHYQYNVAMNLQLLTPLSPAWQQLKLTLRTFFVPNSRVWTNAEKFTAQKGTMATQKIDTMPNINKDILESTNLEITRKTLMTNTTAWRDNPYAPYFVRQGQGEINEAQGTPGTAFVPISALPMRGFTAIYNDFLRNKEHDTEKVEYKNDVVSPQEYYSYYPAENADMARAKRNNSYYTNFRISQQGSEIEQPNGDSADFLTDWASYEAKIAYVRSQAENAELTDWEVIAKIRGSKLLTEGKVQLLSVKEIPLNYSAVTQSAYNNNEQVQEQYRVMGQQGAYSYTEFNVPVYAGFEANEEGYIHIIATVTADTVFESGIDRNQLNIHALDQYNPDLEGDKLDVIYHTEMSTADVSTLSEYTQIYGYKRKYSELFKLPNIISGDMDNRPYYITEDANGRIMTETETIPKATYQFFEMSAERHYEQGQGWYNKLYWKDYSDLLINKNQAIKQTIKESFIDSGEQVLQIEGDNQIFFVGRCELVVDLPVNEEIKQNYSKWGEH